MLYKSMHWLNMHKGLQKHAFDALRRLPGHAAARASSSRAAPAGREQGQLQRPGRTGAAPAPALHGSLVEQGQLDGKVVPHDAQSVGIGCLLRKETPKLCGAAQEERAQ